jgi:CheY-like chemotaxis protein
MSETGERCGPVLIVEDDDDTRGVLGEVLSAEGYEVELAESAEQGLEMLAAGFSPSLILADLHMRGMRGDELASLVRRGPSYARIPVVIMTAALTRVEGPVLRKPFSIDELIEVVERNARRRDALASTRVAIGSRGLEAVA